MHRKHWTGLSLFGIGLAAPAGATDSWLIAQQGARPDRVAVVMDAGTIRNRIDVAGWMATATPQQIAAVRDSAKRSKKKLKPGEAAPPHVGPDIVFEAEAELVYEQRLKPDVAGTWYLINCTRQTIAVTSARVLWRHKAMEEQRGGAEHAIASSVERQIAAFVCGMGSGVWPKDAVPTGLGFTHVGDIGIQASNYVWPKLWADAKRPEFSYIPTKKDIDSSVARFDENVTKAGAAVDRAKAQNADMGRLADKAGRAGKRQGTIPVMEGWIDHSEAEFVAKWGQPIKAIARSDGVRVLSYHWGYVDQLIHPSGAVLSSQDHTCTMNVYVKDTIFDYESEGAGCRDD